MSVPGYKLKKSGQNMLNMKNYILRLLGNSILLILNLEKGSDYDFGELNVIDANDKTITVDLAKFDKKVMLYLWGIEAESLLRTISEVNSVTVVRKSYNGQ